MTQLRTIYGYHSQHFGTPMGEHVGQGRFRGFNRPYRLLPLQSPGGANDLDRLALADSTQTLELRENVAFEVGVLLFHTSGAPRTNAICSLSILAANIREKPVGSHSDLAAVSGVLS